MSCGFGAVLEEVQSGSKHQHCPSLLEATALKASKPLCLPRTFTPFGLTGKRTGNGVFGRTGPWDPQEALNSKVPHVQYLW